MPWENLAPVELRFRLRSRPDAEVEGVEVDGGEGGGEVGGGTQSGSIRNNMSILFSVTFETFSPLKLRRVESKLSYRSAQLSFNWQSPKFWGKIVSQIDISNIILLYFCTWAGAWKLVFLTTYSLTFQLDSYTFKAVISFLLKWVVRELINYKL